MLLRWLAQRLRVACSSGFNGHPPLGVNATLIVPTAGYLGGVWGFNGHPPLGVNATLLIDRFFENKNKPCFNGHPPLGVNATTDNAK